MSQKKKEEMSLADLQQWANQNPEILKFREEEARVETGKKDLLIGQAGQVLDSPAARKDVINYINREHKQGTLDHGEVNDLLIMNPVRLVRIARQVVGKKERKVPGFDLKKAKKEQLKGLSEF